ncbi:MAG: DUF1631 domain-containing protein, partial [Gammaproteobacteria bacterium]|nr:DUF1631 domain-containing protein [Gammaproteobacteria bacterium]
DMWIAGREVVQIPDWQLIALLDHVQDRMIDYLSDSQELTIDFRLFTSYVGEELLESSPAGKLNAIDGLSLDTILTVNLLYDAFCNDVSLVEPIKELIAATQVVMMKMALDDPYLLSRPGHPARLLLNEVASAGVGSLDYTVLKADPVFVKLETILIRLVTEYNGSEELVAELLAEFNEFKAGCDQNAAASAGAGDISENECQARISGIHHYVQNKIEERIQEPLHPLVDNLVRQHFQRFLVGIVQRHGQGSNSWILVTKILDLLLWTIRSEKKDEDRQRFEKLNSMLLPNIKKVLLVSGLGEQASDDLVGQLEQVQEDSFSLWRESSKVGNVVKINNRTFSSTDSDCSEEVLVSLASESSAAELLSSIPQSPAEKLTLATEFPTRKKTEQYLPQVDNLPIGSWLSFQVEGGQSMYCTLTAKLPADERLMFANSKGVKVLEKTREGLARELQQGSARIVSEWPLFERGMESVIARLRERQQQ